MQPENGDTHMHHLLCCSHLAKMVMSGLEPEVPCGSPGTIECRTLTVSHGICGRLCVFPFKFEGVKYDACTYAKSETLWCATEVASDLDMIPNR